MRLRRALKNDEVKLESTLDEMEHLKNSLSASTDDLAVKRAANEHARCAFNLHWLVSAIRMAPEHALELGVFLMVSSCS